MAAFWKVNSCANVPSWPSADGLASTSAVDSDLPVAKGSFRGGAVRYVSVNQFF
jgi:hypothetical protein